MTGRHWPRWLAPLLALAILVTLWEAVLANDDTVQRFNAWIERQTGWNPDVDAFPPSILPRPSQIVRRLLIVPPNGKGGPAYFWRHARSTLAAAALGLLLGNLFAVATATTFLYVKPLERALMPAALALRSIPLVAITPLLLRIRFTLADLPAVQTSPLLSAVFGTDLAIKTLIVVIICYFPTLVNVARGLESVEPAALELLHTLRASRWQVYWKLRVPTALPLTFSALRITSSSSVLGAVVAEWLSSYQGLGYIIKRAHAERAQPNVYAAMLLASCIAISAFVIVNALQRAVIPWHRQVVSLRTAVEGTAPEA